MAQVENLKLIYVHIVLQCLNYRTTADYTYPNTKI